jgi:hypothetical protein
MCIPGRDDASARRSVDIVPNSGKGKGKVVPMGSASRSGSWPLPSDIELSLKDDIPL